MKRREERDEERGMGGNGREGDGEVGRAKLP